MCRPITRFNPCPGGKLTPRDLVSTVCLKTSLFSDALVVVAALGATAVFHLSLSVRPLGGGASIIRTDINGEGLSSSFIDNIGVSWLAL